MAKGVTIYVSNIKAEMKLGSISAKAAEINPLLAYKAAYPSACSGIMIEQYYLCLHEISKVLRDYKALLDKDIAEIRNSINVISVADQNALLNFI